MPSRLTRDGGRRHRRSAATLIAGAAVVAMLAVAAVAIANSFTLKVSKNVHVTNVPTAMFAVKPVNTHEAVAIGPSGYPVYTFQGETTHHIICKKTSSASTNCWAFWPPVTVSSPGSATKASGIKGKGPKLGISLPKELRDPFVCHPSRTQTCGIGRTQIVDSKIWHLCPA